MYINKKSGDFGQQPSEYALPLAECIAKTRIKDGSNCVGRLVFDHCQIVGEVARQMIARMPNWLRENFFPTGSELIAAAHDIGKVSPTFQEKIYQATKGYQKNSKRGLENINPDLEKRWGGHGGVSQAAADAINAGAYIPAILGQHHGYSPLLGERIASDNVFGGNVWQVRREELVAELKVALNCDWPTVNNALQARVLSGLTTVSDWIGSSSWFEDPADNNWQPSIEKALDSAGFIPPKFQTGLSFTDIFGFTSLDAQQKLIEHAIQPGVYILEAPMGFGKTEAALYAAYIAMVAGRATGIYFALPTQLTSDKIHTRVNAFLQKILASDCFHKKALLLYSNAWLKQTEMGEDAQPGGSWFQSGKRGILAPFAVGTIDQALMAVMNVKHGFVRTFGLAGKVVILDEVHSYDAYTGTLLDELVKALRELRCTVIILSATLTHERRQKLLGHELTKQEYPLISVLPTSEMRLQEIEVEPFADKQVAIQLCHEDIQAMEEALFRAEQGQQILWIENTVTEAQTRYGIMASRANEMGVECGLLHSRFLKIDRARNEQHWIDLYGKNGSVARRTKGRILMGTQVLEQSLDIDADFLVTRMCPTDMLLQRLGRLWRHEKTPRPPSALQEAWILAPTLLDAKDNAEKAFGKTANIYSPYVLCRSLEVWEKLKTVMLPKQIRSLIEATYIDREEENKMHSYRAELRKKREELHLLALVGLSQGGKTLPESKASTRYSEQDNVEVLLLRSYRHKDDKTGTYVTLLDGNETYLPRHGKMQDRKQWRKNAVILMQNTLHVANYLAPNSIPAKNLDWLKDYFYLGDREHEESLLRVAIVRNSGDLSSVDSGAASDRYLLNYDAQLGYQAEEK